MPVTYVIRFDIVPGQRECFLGLLNGVLDAMRSEQTFHNAILHRDPENENRMLLYETWEDHDEVLNVQIQRPYRRAFHEALPELLAAPRDISIWHPVRTDVKAGSSVDERPGEPG